MDQNQVDTALAAAMKRLPAEPRVVALRAEPYEDIDREAAIKVRVILADEVSDRQIEAAPILSIEQTIENALEAHGVTLFPYFFFEREDESQLVPGNR